MGLHSYPSIFNFGHRAIVDLLDGDVIVEEKVDGSQFSFGVGTDGVLRIRSKGADIIPDAPPKMFARGVAEVLRAEKDLPTGRVFRGEILDKPKHNTLAYDRVPKGHIMIFDIETADGGWLSPEDKVAEAERLGFEGIPILHVGRVESALALRAFLDRVSVLGGQKIEGVVVKPLGYDKYGTDKKVLMGKFVSEAFKEVHGGEWRKSNPSKGDILETLIGRLATPARWAKAVQHLREEGRIEDSPKDIGALIKEVRADVLKEEKERITSALFGWGWDKIERGLTAGLPQWYKERLLEQQFERDEPAEEVA